MPGSSADQASPELVNRFNVSETDQVGYDSMSVDGQPAGKMVEGRVRFGDGYGGSPWGTDQKKVDRYVIDKNGGTTEMNKALRSGDPTPSQKSQANQLKKLSQRGEFTEDAPVFRRAKFTDEQMKQFKPGTTVVDHGFMSTTGRPQTTYIGSQKEPPGGEAMFRIDVPKGTPVIPAQYGEYVLPAGTKMKIIDVGTVDSQTAGKIGLQSSVLIHAQVVSD